MDKGPEGSRVLPQMVLLICVFVFGWVQILTVQSYPFYQTWDMDHVVFLDALLLRSGLLPDHFGHPGFGQILLFSHLQGLAHSFGWIAIGGIQDLSTSLNPLFGVAEVVEYFRMVSAGLSFLTVVLLWGCLVLLFRPQAWVRAFLFIFLASQSWLAVHGMQSRSESVSLFFFSAHLFFIACATNPSHGIKRAGLFLFGAGIFAGLAFTTKIQSILFLACSPALIYLFAQQQGFRLSLQGAALKGTLLAVLALCFLLILGARLWVYPTHIENFRHAHSQVGVFTYLFVFATGALFVLASDKLSAPKWPWLQSLSWMMSWWSVVFLGILASYSLALLAPSEMKTSWAFMMTTAKTTFFGEIIDYLKQDSKLNLARFGQNLRSVWPWILFHLGLIFVVIRQLLQAESSEKKTTWLWFLSLLLLVGLGWLFIVRMIWRQDIIWYEAILGFVSLFVCLRLELFSDFARHRILRIGLVAILIVQLLNSLWIRPRSTYRERRQMPYLTQVYGGNQIEYTKRMNAFFDPALRDSFEIRQEAAVQARSLQAILRDQRLLFPNLQISSSAIGSLQEGFPLRRDDLSLRWSQIPDWLRKATLIDLADLPNAKMSSLWSLIGLGPALFGMSTAANDIVFWPGRDAHYFILAPEALLSQFSSQDWTTQVLPDRLKVVKGEKTQDWVIARVPQGQEVLSREVFLNGAVFVRLDTLR